MSGKTCLIIRIDDISLRLNSHPTVGYILQAVENWISVSNKLDIYVLVDAPKEISVDEISDYTLFEIIPDNADNVMEFQRVIRLNNCYPLLSKKYGK